MAKTDDSYRTWLGLELAEERRKDLEQWLHEAFELADAAVTVADGTGMLLRVGALAGRRSQLLEPLASGLRNLDPGPVRIEFAATLRALPSRQRPRIYLLPARCYGLAGTLRKLSVWLPPESSPVMLGRAAPYLLAGQAGSGAEPPRRWPPPLPRGLRGPFDAVRLGLYCSQITPESYRLDPLAQVELPVAAAVR